MYEYLREDLCGEWGRGSSGVFYRWFFFNNKGGGQGMVDDPSVSFPNKDPVSTGWWLQIFLEFSPLAGEMIQFD